MRFRAQVLDRLVGLMPPAELRAEALKDRACRGRAPEDPAAPEFERRLDRMCKDVDANGRLSHLGRLVLSRVILRNLETRFRVLDCLERFPEIERIPLEQPVFITGWYRTGSTLLHNVLSQTGAFRVPLFWELIHPCPAEDPRRADTAKVIRETRWGLRAHRFISPDFSKSHRLEAELPHECLHLFENAAFSTMPFFLTEATGYAYWLLDQDASDAYRFYRKQLQLLTWLRPGPRWLLKWPYHSWHLETLFEVFPDARVLRLHRDPTEVVPSTCRLAGFARKSLVRAIDRQALGRFWLDYCALGKRRADRAGEGSHGGQILDVDYRALLSSASGTVERIGEFLGVELRREVATLPLQPSSGSSYAEEFGLSSAEIRRSI